MRLGQSPPHDSAASSTRRPRPASGSVVEVQASSGAEAPAGSVGLAPDRGLLVVPLPEAGMRQPIGSLGVASSTNAGGQLLEKRKFLGFSTHWGFRTRAWQGRPGEDEGKVGSSSPTRIVNQRSRPPLARHGGQRPEAAARSQLRGRAAVAAPGDTAPTARRFPSRLRRAPQSSSPVVAVERRALAEYTRTAKVTS